MVAPWEAADRRQGQATPAPATSTRSSPPASPRASCPTSPACRAPARWPSTPRPAALIALDDVLDVPTYKTETAPALVELGKVDGKIVGVFIKAAVKGLIWYNPKVHDYGVGPADDVGRPAGRQATANKGAAKRPGAWASSPARRPAGRAPTGSRTSSCARPARTSTTSWWQGKIKWTDPGHQERRSRPTDDVVAKTPTAAATTAVDRPTSSVAGDPLFASPPGCAVPPPGELHHRPRRVQDQDGRDRLQLLPVPRHRPAVRGRGRGRRRPVRHVPRHAGRQVADEVPRHRPGPGHLGQARRRAVREQERHRLPGRHQQALGRAPAEREDLRVRRLGPACRPR